MSKHKIMHCLIGAFISINKAQEEDGSVTYRVKISIGNVQKLKTRILYFKAEEPQLEWFDALKKASGY